MSSHIVTSLTVLLALGSLPTRVPDSEAIPTPYIAVGEGGAYYFRMELDPEHPHDSSRARGRVFRVGLEQDELKWEVSGWYAHRVFLSRGGHLLVRVGNWPRGWGPSEEHLAVAFYDRGELLAEYSTLDLIEDRSKVPHSVSHYEFLERGAELGLFRAPRAGSGELFRLTTIDGITYTFDPLDGGIVERQHREPATGTAEVNEER